MNVYKFTLWLITKGIKYSTATMKYVMTSKKYFTEFIR